LSVDRINFLKSYKSIDNNIYFSDTNGRLGITLRPGFDSINTPSYLVSYKYYNGAIVDKNGYIGIDFKERQESVAPLTDKKLSILGDSISTYEGWIPDGYAKYYPRGDIDSYEKTWWWKLIQLSGMTLCRNASWSGSTVVGGTGNTEGFAGCSDTRINDLTNPNNGDTPDIIICYISTNDWVSKQIGTFSSTDEVDKTSENITQIAPAYALMLYKIRNAYPNAVVYCVTSFEGRIANSDDTYPIINAFGETIHDVNHAISEIAHIFGARVIDLNVSGIHYWNVANYMVDGRLHPNSKGTDVISKLIYKQLYNDFINGTGL